MKTKSWIRIAGRCFDGHILDMVELGIEKFVALNEFKVKTISC